MYREIKETPQALLEVKGKEKEIAELASVILERGVRRVFGVGCGTSYYVAIGGLYPLRKHPAIDTYSLPSSEFFLHYLPKVDERTAVIGISRSGYTAETLEALRKAKEKGAVALCITCSEESEMVEISNHAVAFSVEEESIVMTKTFTAMSYALLCFSPNLLAYTDGGSLVGELLSEWRRVPKEIAKVLEVEEDVKHIASPLAKERAAGFIFLGTGPTYAVALEGSLKLKETSYVISEAMPALEFRHGPMALLGENVKIIIVSAMGAGDDIVSRLILDIERRGIEPLLFTNSEDLRCSKKVYVPTSLSCDLITPVLIVPLQLLAYYHCTAKGLNPDRPRHLVKYVGKF